MTELSKIAQDIRRYAKTLLKTADSLDGGEDIAVVNAKSHIASLTNRKKSMGQKRRWREIKRKQRLAEKAQKKGLHK